MAAKKGPLDVTQVEVDSSIQGVTLCIMLSRFIPSEKDASPWALWSSHSVYGTAEATLNEAPDSSYLTGVKMGAEVCITDSASVFYFVSR